MNQENDKDKKPITSEDLFPKSPKDRKKIGFNGTRDIVNAVLSSYEKDKEKKQKNKFKIFLLKFKSFFFTILFFMMLNSFFFLGHVPSPSMENTIMTNSYILANRFSYSLISPEYDDIIIFRNDENSPHLVKRVIGVGGDYIEIKDGFVYRNGEKLDAEYIQGTTLPDGGVSEFNVPEDSFFVMGDNREHSADSRRGFYVRKKSIDGKVFLIMKEAFRIPIGIKIAK